MTLSQFKGFLAAATRAEQREQWQTLMTVALGAQGSGDAIEEAVNNLMRAAHNDDGQEEFSQYAGF